MNARNRRNAPIWIVLALVAVGIAWFASRSGQREDAPIAIVAVGSPRTAESSTDDLAAPRALTVRAIAADTESTNDEPATSELSESEDEELDLIPSQYALRVHLLDEFGAPIVDRATSLYLIGAGGVHRSSDRGDKGVHEFRRLVAGTWRIAASALGYEPASDEVQVDSTTKGVERNLVILARDCVRIRLESAAGRPVKSTPGAGFDAIASRDRREGLLREKVKSGALLCGYTTSRDQARLDENYLGLLVLDCERPVWVHLVLGTTILDVQRLDRGVDELKFVVPDGAPDSMLASLRLHPVDAVSGEPILGVIGFLRVGPRSTSVSVGSTEPMIYGGVLPGLMELELRARGYESRTLEIELQPSEERDLGYLAMSAGKGSELRIVWSAKDPIENALVHWGDADDRRPDGEFGTSVSAQSSRDGQVRPRVSAGTWHVWATAEHDDHEYTTRPVIASVDGGIVDIALQLELVAHLVLLPTGGRCSVTIVDPTSSRATAMVHEVDVSGAVLDLPVGAWDVEVTPKDGATRTERIELGIAGLTLRLDR